ncbi:MAG: hypothetical protein Q4D16_16550 [Eubacteriales bacterium]|nr:hypothetical protein [Eubacteriales bacterium]
MNMSIHCSVDAKYTRLFLDACDGNWHNCIYVNCPSCKFQGTCREPDFLCCLDQDGQPLLLPLSDARLLFPRTPEPTECVSILTAAQFLSVYHRYLEKQQICGTLCPCMALLRIREAQCYDW